MSLNPLIGMDYAATLQQLATSLPPVSHPAQLLNPIDRLYSMQNSYFNPQDSNSF